MGIAYNVLREGLGTNGAAFFTGGMSSGTDPMFIDDRAYRHAQNILNRGGVLRTRPGYQQVATLPDGKLQGLFYHRPLQGEGILVAVVAGLVYLSPYPFTAFTALPNIQLYAFAPQVYFASATSSAVRNADGTISAAEPKRTLIVQDGGYTRAAYWDGESSGHIDPTLVSSTRTFAGTGTVSAFAGFPGVVGVGTSFLSQVNVGDTLVSFAGDTLGVVQEVQTDVLLILASPVSFSLTGSAFSVTTAAIAGAVFTKGTPLGGPTAWSGNRLWVASGNKVFAGDISNPKSFTENEYAADGGFFLFDDDVVALAEVPSLDSPVLLVFTKTKTYRILSGIQDRSKWKTTDNFQSTIFPDIGCTSARSVVAQKGILWWMTQTGLTNLNAAAQAKISSKLVPQDTAMAISKFNLSPNLTGVAIGSYENFVLCSVPYADRYNSHTWVLDTSVTDAVDQGSTEAWAGVWSGTRPVAWATGMFGGVSRVFFVSFDFDNKNRVWEAFVPSRTDNDNAISCFVETKTHVDFSQKATGLDRKQFRFAETTFSDIVGNVDVQVYWAGTRGKYKLLATHHLVSTASVASGTTYVNATGVANNQGQTRTLRTPSVKDDPNAACTVRTIESDNADWIDVGFSLLIVWTGNAALRSYRIFADPFEEPDSGLAQVTESGTKVVAGSVCA